MTVLKKVKSDLKPVLCADFESIFESVESYEGFYSKISRSQSKKFPFTMSPLKNQKLNA